MSSLSMKTILACMFACVADSPVFAAGQGVKPGYAGPSALGAGEGNPASIDLQTLVSNATDGATIELPEGTITISGQISLDRGITLRGAGMDKTIIMPTAESLLPAKDAVPGTMVGYRMFLLDHPNCVMEDLTVKGGYTDVVEFKDGIAVLIGPKGGTLRRCRVTECTAKGYWNNGFVAITGDNGLVSHCIVNGNSGVYQNGAVAIKAGRLENTLIQGNRCYDAGGLSYLGGFVCNCTIVDNHATGKNGGGLLWRPEGNVPDVCLQNLIVYGNHAKNDTGEGSPEWSCGESGSGAFGRKTSHCLFGNGRAAGVDPVSGDPIFKDPANNDYSLMLGSAAVDAGADCASLSDTDLAGNARKSGAAVDVGCYELDSSVNQCGFAVEPAFVFEGDKVKLTAFVCGNLVGQDLRYEWVLTGPENIVVDNAEREEFVTLTQPGKYDVDLTVAYGEAVQAHRSQAITVIAKHVYVVSPETPDVNPVEPWNTPETASTNLLEVVEKVPAGTEVLIAEGTYRLPAAVYIGKGITLSGAGMDKSVFLPADENMKDRLFHLNHPDCVVQGLTVKGTKLADEQRYGDGVLIGAHGGTFRRCRVTRCQSPRYLHHGAVALMSKDGLIDCCIIDNNTNLLHSVAGGVYMTDGRMENSLIYENSVDWDGGGLYYAGGVVRNCTIADNIALRHGSGAFCAGSGSSGICIANVLFSGSNGASGTSSVFEFDSGKVNQEAFAAKVSHCFFSEGTPIGADSQTGDPKFLNPKKGDFRISQDSPAHDAGLYEPWMDAATDLDGNPRIDRKQFVDIGCYEAAYVNPAMMILLR